MFCRYPNFFNTVDINEDICIVQMKHKIVVLDKPIYAGGAILDLSKTLMYNFHYGFARKKFVKDGKTPDLCYMDTDSFIYNIPMSAEERDRVILENQTEFDCNDYPVVHPLKSDVNKKVIPTNLFIVGNFYMI